ncbi:MAG: hypothetical protein ACHQNT_05640 [Bacteroidia bacterium]
MNKSQKIVLIITAIILVIMLLFPPFIIEINNSKFNLGYNFIFSPPSFGGVMDGFVDSGTLLLQLLVVIFTGISFYFIFKKNPKT